MSFDKDDDAKKFEEELKKSLQKQAEDDESGEDSSGATGSTGGAAGEIQFRDFIFPAESARDDLLPNEIRHLLAIHDNANKENVKKQKDKRDTYKSLKEGKKSLSDYRQDMAQTGDKPAHPVLSNKAQFSGSNDKQVTPVVDENVANTNDANRNELELQYSLRHRPQNAPRFNPKPSPYRQ